MATRIQEKQRSKNERHQRWARLERTDLFEWYGELHTQGASQRQAAKVLDVPRSTLQAWGLSQVCLDACPAVVAFFHSVPGLAFLHQLVMALHVVCVDQPRKRACLTAGHNFLLIRPDGTTANGFSDRNPTQYLLRYWS